MHRMNALHSGLVDIVRDFFAAHRAMGVLFESHRARSLRFKQVEQLAGDSDTSVLFRLKERCHILFRDPHDPRMRRRTLLDLAVGSLFHEAMKVRENLYQLEVYGPKVRELRRDLQGESSELFEEFERILMAAEERLAEAVEESRALLGQTRNQLLRVLSDHDGHGLIARYCIEHRDRSEDVFGRPLDDLLSVLHGTPEQGYLRAGHSYVASAHFAEADAVLVEALRLRPECPRAGALTRLAAGFEALVEGQHEDAVAGFEAFLPALEAGEDGPLVERLRVACRRLLARADLAPPLRERVTELAGRLPEEG